VRDDRGRERSRSRDRDADSGRGLTSLSVPPFLPQAPGTPGHGSLA
jgi:hypothetical protein